MAHEEIVDRETGQVGIVYGDRELASLEGLDPLLRQVAGELQTWVEDTRKHGMIERPKFEDAKDTIAQMVIAREIVASDDVVANFLEISEGIALAGVKWESSDELTADLFNQMAAEHDLDSLMRKMWREDFTLSQSVIAAYWGEGEFKVRGETESGNKRKARRTVYYPQRFAVLDSTKVIPVEVDAFGGERLALKATPEEKAYYQRMLNGEYQDAAMARFYAGWYKPRPEEEKELGRHAQDLILLDRDAVARHTATKSDYERWAPVRLRSIFRLVDMKHHLLDADRVALIGAANYILLVRKGDKDNPAHAEEIRNLKEGFKTLAKIPVIFSDHRLSIEIITPKQDYTLQSEKYDLLDIRIMQRLLNALAVGGTQGGYKMELGKPTSSALSGRRHMLKRFLERAIARAVIEHPKNAHIDWPEGPPSLSFSPAQIRLGDDAQFYQQLLALRTQKEISRESVLELFGLDQAVEAMRRKIEEARYDDVFKTVVPFSSPNMGGGQGQVPADQAGNGAQGGRPKGGGKTSQNPTRTNVTDQGTTRPTGGKS